MNNLSRSVEDHYFKQGLYEDIVSRLQDLGVDLANVSRKDLSPVDEFHVRGAEVSVELANCIPIQGMKVLDVGCGIGGPCRLLAEEFNCQMTGIDLSAEFVRTATELTRLVGLSDSAEFVQGDATEMRFEDDSFDVAWTQHVQMNIPDKEGLYNEIKRVVRPGGYFLYYDIFLKGEGAVEYPMPWATNETQSFLFSTDDLNDIMNDLGAKRIKVKDQTVEGIEFFRALAQKLRESGPPKLGLNVLMGESTKGKLMNLLEHMEQGKLELESGLWQFAQ